MIMRVRLLWTNKNYGTAEHRVYRSDSPMDPENLPTPIATLGGSAREYIDDDAALESGESYYYRMEAVTQGQAKVSTELEVTFELLDPLFSDVILLLPMDQFPGLTGTDFPDLSWVESSVSSFGPQLVSSPAKFGQSGDFTVSGNDVRLEVGPDPAFEIAGDFTLEFWARRPDSGTTSYGRIFDARESAFQSGAFSVWHSGGDFGGHVTGEIALTLSGQYLVGTRFNHNDGVWHHVAFVRSGSTIKCYLDGVETASASNSTVFNRFASEGFCIGRAGDGRTNSAFKGHLDDLRLTKAVRYTANFAPPDEPNWFPATVS